MSSNIKKSGRRKISGRRKNLNEKKIRPNTCVKEGKLVSHIRGKGPNCSKNSYSMERINSNSYPRNRMINQVIRQFLIPGHPAFSKCPGCGKIKARCTCNNGVI